MGPEQGLPQVVYKAWSCARAMAPKKVMKVAMKKVTKKPSGNPPVPNKDEEMSLEDKMELFVRSKQQNVANWLDTLTKGQRETLWQRFSRARDGLKDPVVTNIWESQCKGPKSDPLKKRLLGVFLNAQGDLKNSQAWQKEMVTLSKSTGLLDTYAFDQLLLVWPPLF